MGIMIKGGTTDTNRTRRKCIQLSDTMGEFFNLICKKLHSGRHRQHQCQVVPSAHLICPNKLSNNTTKHLLNDIDR